MRSAIRCQCLLWLARAAFRAGLLSVGNWAVGRYEIRDKARKLK